LKGGIEQLEALLDSDYPTVIPREGVESNDIISIDAKLYLRKVIPREGVERIVERGVEMVEGVDGGVIPREGVERIVWTALRQPHPFVIPREGVESLLRVD